MSGVVRYEAREVFRDPIYCIYDRFMKDWYKEHHQSVSFKKWSEARAYAKMLNQKEHDGGHRYRRTKDGISSRLIKKMVKQHGTD